MREQERFLLRRQKIIIYNTILISKKRVICEQEYTQKQYLTRKFSMIWCSNAVHSGDDKCVCICAARVAYFLVPRQKKMPNNNN